MTSKKDLLKKLHTEKLLQDNKGKTIDITEPKKLGVTNQYCTVSINGVPALIYRLAGQQWCCGFTRSTESYNIKLVEHAGVSTGIVYFDSFDGTQISTYSTPADISGQQSALNYAISSLKKIHSSQSFMKNDYSVASMVQGAYSRVPEPYRHHFFSKVTPLINRIISVMINDKNNIVPSHNEPYPANFTLGTSQDDYRVIDWEYSGNNNRYWDLAFLSVTSKLKLAQENFLLNEYFNGELSNEELVKFYSSKVVVQFALMLWLASGLGKCSYPIGCDLKRLERLAQESDILNQFIQKMYESVSPRAYHLPSFLFFSGSNKKSSGTDQPGSEDDLVHHRKIILR